MTQPRPLVAGNWKMNGVEASLAETASLLERLNAAPGLPADVMVCPPATLLARMAAQLQGSAILVGGQDCHASASGAHTGDISADMIKDAGASAVIVGHSERRTDHGESDETVRAKAAAVLKCGLTAIICIGETEGQRKSGETLAVVSKQLSGSLPEGITPKNTIIAYEPVWAIGTGLTPTPDDVAEVHAHIRSELTESLGEGTAGGIRLLYGGSVKPDNASELMSVANVDGALVGGASLKADDFWGILFAYEKNA